MRLVVTLLIVAASVGVAAYMFSRAYHAEAGLRTLLYFMFGVAVCAVGAFALTALTFTG